MEKIDSGIQKSALLSLLNGYKRANELIIKEKKKWLAQLTREDSLREYDKLCRIWEKSSKESLDKLERQKILFLIEFRRRLNKGGRFKDESAI